jgi:hypothetical protein
MTFGRLMCRASAYKVAGRGSSSAEVAMRLAAATNLEVRGVIRAHPPKSTIQDILSKCSLIVFVGCATSQEVASPFGLGHKNATFYFRCKLPSLKFTSTATVFNIDSTGW